MSLKLKLELANNDDIKELCDLVNAAYRGKLGWTKETEIIDGNRTTDHEIRSLISSPNTYLFIARENNKIISCICIEKNDHQAYIGLLAVNPAYQNKGLGKHILNLAESYAVNHLKISEFMMAVISQRKELIAFYERRGYKRTGNIEAYPIHLNVGTPRIDNLTIEYLKKHVVIPE
ncbi:MAG: GNAT family N-acetyltransferase [Pseudomonadota bacterium]